MRMLDLFCGRFGWSKAFAARGWECIGVDLTVPPEDSRQGCTFIQADVLGLSIWGQYFERRLWIDGNAYEFDFICASSPCEQFSVHGMKHFHPNPKYPELGIKLFNHTRALCEASGCNYVMENVRAAQQFVGIAQHHCGPFYLWGNAVPPMMPQGIKKGMNRMWNPTTRQRSKAHLEQVSSRKVFRKEQTDYRRIHDPSWSSSGSLQRLEFTAKMAEVPPELSACVADYAERLIEQSKSA